MTSGRQKRKPMSNQRQQEPTKPPKPHLLTLPLEIRHKIYGHLFNTASDAKKELHLPPTASRRAPDRFALESSGRRAFSCLPCVNRQLFREVRAYWLPYTTLTSATHSEFLKVAWSSKFGSCLRYAGPSLRNVLRVVVLDVHLSEGDVVSYVKFGRFLERRLRCIGRLVGDRRHTLYVELHINRIMDSLFKLRMPPPSQAPLPWVRVRLMKLKIRDPAADLNTLAQQKMIVKPGCLTKFEWRRRFEESVRSYRLDAWNRLFNLDICA